MNNLKQQIKQIRDTKEFYHITDNFYRKNNILYIRRIITKYNSFILYNKKLNIKKFFNISFPYIYSNNEYYKQFIEKNSKFYKDYQTLFFFDQITNE